MLTYVVFALADAPRKFSAVQLAYSEPRCRVLVFRKPQATALPTPVTHAHSCCSVWQILDVWWAPVRCTSLYTTTDTAEVPCVCRDKRPDGRSTGTHASPTATLPGRGCSHPDAQLCGYQPGTSIPLPVVKLNRTDNSVCMRRLERHLYVLLSSATSLRPRTHRTLHTTAFPCILTIVLSCATVTGLPSTTPNPSWD